MEISSRQIGTKLRIDIKDLVNKKAVLETIEGCASGQCACSTDEYQKVESLEISSGSNFIQLDIAVKPGETIDPACISECLDPDQN